MNITQTQRFAIPTYALPRLNPGSTTTVPSSPAAAPSPADEWEKREKARDTARLVGRVGGAGVIGAGAAALALSGGAAAVLGGVIGGGGIGAGVGLVAGALGGLMAYRLTGKGGDGWESFGWMIGGAAVGAAIGGVGGGFAGASLASSGSAWNAAVAGVGGALVGGVGGHFAAEAYIDNVIDRH